jgi:hypothetical protein
VEAFGAAVALLIVLLPGAGVLVRWIAFAAGNLPASPFQVAYSAPVSELVVTAVWSLRLTAFYVAYFFLTAEVFRWRRWRILFGYHTQPRGKPRDWRRAIPLIGIGGIFMVLGFGLIAYEFLNGSGWPYQLVTLIGFLMMISLAALLVRSPERPRLSRVWPVVIVALGVAAIGQGLVGSLQGTPIGRFSFQPSLASVVSDGRYQELGNADGNIYLQNCANGRVTRVSNAAVTAVTFERPAEQPPSALEIIGGKKLELGWRNEC